MNNDKAFTGNFKKIAFTLAEILITLGIIGVVAALTIPSLIQKKQNKVLEVQFKKSYSIISQAMLNVVENEYGGIVEFGNSDLGNLILILSKYYKDAQTTWPVLENYPNNTETARCNFLANYYKNYTGKTGATRFNDGIIQISDGSTIYFDVSALNEVTYGTIFIAVDINGWRAKPNKYGYDFFVFKLEKNGKITPMGSDDSLYPASIYCSKNSTNVSNGYGCTYSAFSDPKYFDKLK